MNLIKKSFGNGVFIGFILSFLLMGGLLIGAFVTLKFYFSGESAKKILKEALSYSHDNRFFESIRSVSHEIKTEIKTSTAKKETADSQLRNAFFGNRVEGAGSFVTWIAPSSDRIFPDESPKNVQIKSPGQSRPISVVGLKGETVSFQLVLRSKVSHDNIKVKALIDPSPQAQSCIQVHRYLEIFLHLMMHKGKYGPLVKIDEPDPLVPFHDPYTPGHIEVSRIHVDSNVNQPVWIDFHFSRACPAQTFHGQLVVIDGSREIRKSPINFSILDAEIPTNTHLKRLMQLYVSRFWEGELIPSNKEDEFDDLFIKYYLMAHQYGFSLTTCGDYAPHIDFDLNTGRIKSIDWSSYDKLFGPILSGQLTGSPPNTWCYPVTPDNLGSYWVGFSVRGATPDPIENWKGIPDIAAQSLAAELVRHWKEKNWDMNKAFIYAFDEPVHELVFYPDFYELIAKASDSIEKGSNHLIKFMITDAPYPWEKRQFGHNKRVMKGKVDIWAAGTETLIPERLAIMQKFGDKVWFYGGFPPFIGGSDLSSKGPGFRMWFWTAWKYREDGIFNWAANFWHGNTMSENPFLRPGTGDGIVFYPGHQLHLINFPDMNGPVPSIRMAQWRRGYEDYKYFVLLKKEGKGKTADSIVNKLVRKALDDGGYIPYWRNPLWEKPGDWSHDPREWHQERIQMAHELANLNKGDQ